MIFEDFGLLGKFGDLRNISNGIRGDAKGRLGQTLELIQIFGIIA
jgi:hypothetical protein